MELFKTLKRLVSGKAKTKPFLETVKEYHLKLSVENCLTEGTVLKHTYIYNNLSLFLHSKRMVNATLDQITPKLMEDLKFWLHSNLVTCSATHSARHIETCKRTMKYARKMEYIINNPIDEVTTIKDKAKPVVYLEQNEIKKIMVYKFQNAIYQIVADLYIFQCYTGLSYGDLYNYEIVKKGQKEWIKGARIKNNSEYIVYLFKEAKELHNKYEGKLPFIANQTYNRVLKEIALLLNIKKNLTTHTGRKTHATLLNEIGVSDKGIANQLGNTEEVCRKHYIKNTFKTTENEFNRLGIKENLIFNV